MSVRQANIAFDNRLPMGGLVTRYLDWLTYHHRMAEWMLLLLFFTGLVLWDRIPMVWPVFRWSLIIHVAAGLIIFPLTTGLFWVSHRRLLKSSKKPFLRITGQLLDWLLSVCFLSGLILAFWGATGNTLSTWVSDIHWVSGLLMGPMMVRHAWRFSVLRFFKRG